MSTSREQNERIFNELYAAHADALFRYVYLRLRSRDEALDVVQTVFTNLWRYIEHGSEIEYPKTFLYRSARNTLINAVRDRKPHDSLDDLMEHGLDVPYTEADTQELERQQEVVERISTIDESYREVLILRYVDGLKVKEIATLLDESENNISVRIHRGLQKLKSHYENT